MMLLCYILCHKVYGCSAVEAQIKLLQSFWWGGGSPKNMMGAHQARALYLFLGPKKGRDPV